MNCITNYYQVTEHISSSGQPFSDQFEEIAQAGFEVVIDLTMPDSHNSIINEGAIVAGLGMIYQHIPVPWQTPGLIHYRLFVESMNRFRGKKVWVHCAMNMRASCLIYLYRRKHLGVKKDQAIFPMNKIWQPEGIWLSLIEQVLSSEVNAA